MSTTPARCGCTNGRAGRLTATRHRIPAAASSNGATRSICKCFDLDRPVGVGSVAFDNKACAACPHSGVLTPGPGGFGAVLRARFVEGGGTSAGVLGNRGAVVPALFDIPDRDRIRDVH